ncbi:MAG: SMC-Scp complex subunit ScpB [Gammaproteobacteria bacterium]|nr:SMC-Scp complex subunit ScpB [Gammaproteobacteria bacterium]|tara:strand:+ start:207 stop:731 length:525 start_codon:yes stop_codon:yes gene_type:complete
MSPKNKLDLIIESALLVAQTPLTLQELANLFDIDKPSKNQIKQSIDTLNKSYVNRSFEIIQVASGYRIQVKNGYEEWLVKLDKQSTTRYSKAFLETLVIIAYKQPVTRGDIEGIRGVSVNPQIIRNMIEYEWVKVVGHKDTPGKPELLATTKKFLDYFNMQSIKELPQVDEITE